MFLSLMTELTVKHFPVFKPGLNMFILSFSPSKLKLLKTLILLKDVIYICKSHWRFRKPPLSLSIRTGGSIFFSLHFGGTVFSKNTMRVYSHWQLRSFERSVAPNYGCPFASYLPVNVSYVIR